MTKNIFLAGWEVHLNGDQQCNHFIETQATDRKTAENVCGIELVFEENLLTQAYFCDQHIRNVKELKLDELGLPFRIVEINKILQLVDDCKGIHQLGGDPPSDFHFPENNCLVPFQYLGYIDKEDKYFGWLPNKVHLTCPIYLNIGYVFLDYSNPMNPILINRFDVEKADTSYGNDLNHNSEIVFNAKKISFIEMKEFSDTGHAGIPKWIQYPDIPICPISGKKMKFLCQLKGGVSTNRSNVIPKEEWSKPYYEALNFWGDGDLFIFFEPSSNVACYLIQNT